MSFEKILKFSMLITFLFGFFYSALYSISNAGIGFPNSIQNAEVNIQDCKDVDCEFNGMLVKSWTGTYKMRIEPDVYIELHHEDLVSSEGERYVFKSGWFRSDPVVVINEN